MHDAARVRQWFDVADGVEKLLRRVILRIVFAPTVVHGHTQFDHGDTESTENYKFRS